MASLDQLKTAGLVDDLEGWDRECALSGTNFAVSYPSCSFAPGDCVSEI